MPPSIGVPLTRERFEMRDNTKKTRTRHLRRVFGPAGAALLVATSAILAYPATAAAQKPTEAGKACAVAHATSGALGQIQEGVLVIDARPYQEFAMSHIPASDNVAPKPGLHMSQFTSDVGEIEKLTQGKKGRTIVLYCNGPFCGKSKLLAAYLLATGYTHVVRYQLGIPV